MLILQSAPENAVQAGEGERGASGCWFATHSDDQEAGSEAMRLAQDWGECAAEGDSPKVRQLVTRNVDAVSQRLATGLVAMVHQASLYARPEARRKSPRLIAMGIP